MRTSATRLITILEKLWCWWTHTNSEVRYFQGYKDQALPVRPEILLVDRIFRPSKELFIAVTCAVIFGFINFISSLLDLRLLGFVFLSFRRLRSRGQPYKPATARVLTTSLETMELQGHPLGLYPVTSQLVRISDNLLVYPRLEH